MLLLAGFEAEVYCIAYLAIIRRRSVFTSPGGRSGPLFRVPMYLQYWPASPPIFSDGTGLGWWLRCLKAAKGRYPSCSSIQNSAQPTDQFDRKFTLFTTFFNNHKKIDGRNKNLKNRLDKIGQLIRQWQSIRRYYW